MTELRNITIRELNWVVREVGAYLLEKESIGLAGMIYWNHASNIIEYGTTWKYQQQVLCPGIKQMICCYAGYAKVWEVRRDFSGKWQIRVVVHLGRLQRATI